MKHANIARVSSSALALVVLLAAITPLTNFITQPAFAVEESTEGTTDDTADDTTGDATEDPSEETPPYPGYSADLQAVLDTIPDQAAGHKANLEALKQLDTYAQHAELWAALDAYLADPAELTYRSGSGFGANRKIYIQPQYKADKYFALVGAIQAVDSDFEPISNSYYDLMDSVSHLSAADVNAIFYETMVVNFYDTLINRPEACAAAVLSYANATDATVARSFTVTLEDSEFLTDAYAKKIYLTELYNRVMSRSSLQHVAQPMLDWSQTTGTYYTNLRSNVYLLTHGEAMVSRTYYTGSTGFGANRKYLENIVSEGIGSSTYTLKQAVDFLPTNTTWPGSNESIKDEIIARTERAYYTELANLKANVTALDPSQTDLDSKTDEELVAIAQKVLEEPQSNNLSDNPAIQEFDATLIQFNMDMINQIVSPEAKYFENQTRAVTETPAISQQIALNDFATSTTADQLVTHYYGLLGQQALPFDKTITAALPTHEIWPDPSTLPDPVNPEQPETPGSTDPSNPTQDDALDTPESGAFAAMAQAAPATKVAYGSATVAALAAVAYLTHSAHKRHQRRR